MTYNRASTETDTDTDRRIDPAARRIAPPGADVPPESNGASPSPPPPPAPSTRADFASSAAMVNDILAAGPPANTDADHLAAVVDDPPDVAGDETAESASDPDLEAFTSTDFFATRRSKDPFWHRSKPESHEGSKTTTVDETKESARQEGKTNKPFWPHRKPRKPPEQAETSPRDGPVESFWPNQKPTKPFWPHRKPRKPPEQATTKPLGGTKESLRQSGKAKKPFWPARNPKPGEQAEASPRDERKKSVRKRGKTKKPFWPHRKPRKPPEQAETGPRDKRKKSVRQSGRAKKTFWPTGKPKLRGNAETKPVSETKTPFWRKELHVRRRPRRGAHSERRRPLPDS